MNQDYATILLKQYANCANERTAAHAVKVIDRAILEAFAPEDRELIQQILPGMTRRRLGARFGLTRTVPKGKAIDFDALLVRLRRELSLTDTSEAQTILDGYIKAHITLMTSRTRLNFATLCEGDMLRAYLRVADSLTA